MFVVQQSLSSSGQLGLGRRRKDEELYERFLQIPNTDRFW